MAAFRATALSIGSAALLLAQTPTIRTSVPLVQVPVSVTDRSGRFVFGLSANDFVVSDEGRPVSVHVDDPDLVSAPLAVVVLVQETDISDSALLKIKQVGSMIGGAVVGAEGSAALVTYSDRVEVAQPLTSNDAAIAQAFRDLRSVDSRGGRLHDAVAQALDLLHDRPAPARSAIVVIGESKDRGSKTPLSQLLPNLQKSGAIVYALNYSAFLTPFTTRGGEYSPPEGGRGLLDIFTESAHAMKEDTSRVLTATTGGRIFRFETKSKLENDLIGLGADVHSRYLLSFTPAASDNGHFRRLQVQVKGRPDLAVHARAGYWPSR